ncbi:MAG: archease [Chloroflexota bacterium]|jgi:SHS2 domain-containing protein
MEKAEKFQFLPHTADVAVLVRGKSLQDLFANGALALYSVLIDPSQVRDTVSMEIDIEAPELESLFVDWLNELLFLFECEGMLYSRLDLRELSESRLRGVIWGEKLDASRHRVKTGVKAATYHDLEVGRVGDEWLARVVLDV